MKRTNSFSAVSALLLVLFPFPGSSYSQSIYFCEDVDDDGYAINSSSVFNIPDDGGYLTVLTRLGYEVDCDEVLFDIYRVDSRGKETFDNTIYMDVEPDWIWFWKHITFYDPGTYKIYVYDEDSNLITSGKVKVKYN